MKKILPILIVLFTCTSTLSGQLGLDISYQKSNYPDWNDILKDQGFDQVELFRHGYGIGLDFGFGLPQYRVEFYPGVAYKRSVTEYADFGFENAVDYRFDLKQFGIQVRTQVYPLDLLSKKGMQCPSFHRGEDVLTKGWFVLFQPGVLYSIRELDGYRYLNLSEPLEVVSREGKLIFDFSIGTGLDIGLSESFSISPSIRYGFILGERWNGFTTGFDQPSYLAGTAVSYLAYFIRIGLWF
jgi:hypothetical protein